MTNLVLNRNRGEILNIVGISMHDAQSQLMGAIWIFGRVQRGYTPHRGLDWTVTFVVCLSSPLISKSNCHLRKSVSWAKP